ncbi:hypothetical protein PI125_g9415 [Phytophthora idaei]|nr:hypothetical protein PI125_g9415 [Phytophthora idaei]KAG3139280.1 hypothetical protein PI126_g16527 [Phytophthora idaei]
MGGAESAEMDPKQKLAAAGGKTKAKKETQVKKVEGGVTTYTTAASTEKKAPVADFEAVSEQKSSSKGGKTPHHEPETEPNNPSKAPVDGEDTKTEVFRTVEPDGCVVTKTVRTTRRTTTSATGQLVTVIEVDTTTETEELNGETTTSSKTETTTETESKSIHQRHDAEQRPSVVSTTATTSTGESVQTEVFQSQEADGSIVTKTVKTTTRTSTSASGELVKTIEVETTTETETKSGEKSTTVETETREETEVEESSLATTSNSTTTVSGGRAIRSTVEAGAAPGESVQTEVFQSQEADGSIVTKTVKTTTRTSTSASGELVKTIEVETTTETETKSGEKSTTVETETREETETTTMEETTVTSEDVSGDKKKVSGVATAAYGVATAATTGGIIGSAVHATRSTTGHADVGSTETAEVMETTEVTETATSEDVSAVTSEDMIERTRNIVSSGISGNLKLTDEYTLVVLGLAGRSKGDSKMHKVKESSFRWTWLAQFVSFCETRGLDIESISSDEVRELSRDFCMKNLSSFSENLYESGSLDEKRAAWNVSQTLAVQFPELAVHDFGLEFGQYKRVLMIDEVSSEDKKVPDAANAQVLTSMLKESPKLSGGYKNVLITEGGETVFYGSAKSLIAFFQEFGFAQPQNVDVTEFLLSLGANSNTQFYVTVVDRANEEKENRRIQSLSSFMSFPDDTVILTGTNLSDQGKKSIPDDNQGEDQQMRAKNISVSATTTERMSAGSRSATSAVSGEESSAALVAAGTAAMSSLYARHAHEGSNMESTTFSADIDAAAQEIQRVCTGTASDEAALASLLLSKTVEQRYLIWWRYRILYKQSLTVWVKSTSDYGVLLQMLASPLEHVEAEILRKTTKDLGTTEEWIYPVVMARSNSEIALLKKTFQEKYGEDLVKVLSGELSGELKKVILTAMRGEVADFNASIHTSAKAAADADALYKAGEGRMGTDEMTFINILVLSPAEHVRNINSAYVAKYKTDLVGAISAEFSGDAKRALLFLVRSVLEPVELFAELFETTLKSAGKNAYGLSAWVVRYYRLLVRIRIVYMRLYGQELRTRIQGVVSGEYCQLLVSVFDAAEVEFGASASGSGSASAAVVSGSSAAVSGAAIGTSASVEEKTSVSSSGAVSAGATERVSAMKSVSAGSRSATSAVSGEESSAALVAAGTAAMSSLYARHAHEGSNMESTTFSADIDAAAQEIQRVCTGTASDEAALASLLLSKTVEQRYLIWWRYRILYKQSLTVWVKSTSDYGVLLQMLASPLEHVEAEILRKTTKGLGTTEEWIYPVVMARSNSEIALLKKTFQEKYGEDLVKVLSGELSGELKKVILTAMRGEVADFNASIHTSAKAAADADALYKAGEGRMGTDEMTFINILVLSPAEHLRNIDAAYSKKYKKMSIIKAIKGEFKGDTQTALRFHVRMVFEPFELLAELFESTMKGLGTDEYGLSVAVVRYHAMLPQIKTAYKKLYGKELSKRIRGDTSGEYRDLLLAIVDGQ